MSWFSISPVILRCTGLVFDQIRVAESRKWVTIAIGGQPQGAAEKQGNEACRNLKQNGLHF